MIELLKLKHIIPFDEVCSAVYIAGVNGIILCLERERGVFNYTASSIKLLLPFNRHAITQRLLTSHSCDCQVLLPFQSTCGLL